MIVINILWKTEKNINIGKAIIKLSLVFGRIGSKEKDANIYTRHFESWMPVKRLSYYSVLSQSPQPVFHFSHESGYRQFPVIIQGSCIVHTDFLDCLLDIRLIEELKQNIQDAIYYYKKGVHKDLENIVGDYFRRHIEQEKETEKPTHYIRYDNVPGQPIDIPVNAKAPLRRDIKNY